MRMMTRLALLALVLAGSAFVATPASAHPTRVTIGSCKQDTLRNHALSLICVPTSGWNGDLVVWAHGYVAFNQPLGFYNLSFGGVDLPTLVQSLGYAFATTSYRKNGLVILEGVDDVRQLVAAFPGVAGQAPVHTYMVGASEGGIVTTLLTERYPELFSGSLALCGPIGSFRGQLNYWGDFRVLFNYFFPGLVPGDATNTPQSVIDNWSSTYQPAISSTIPASPTATAQLIRTSRAPFDAANVSATELNTTQDLMWYAAFATNDGVTELGGVPYDNTRRWYTGSSNDWQLNTHVQRVRADQSALNEVAKYETSGNITIPLVTLHTIGDDVIPYWNELLYILKAHTSGKGVLLPIPINAYGHCNFTVPEVLGGFALMVYEATKHVPAGLVQYMPRAQRDLALAHQVLASRSTRQQARYDRARLNGGVTMLRLRPLAMQR